jgi:hypothetical protein
VTIKRDATPPVVSYSGNAGTYTVDKNVNITCTAQDAPAGLASNTCANATGTAFTFGLGPHPLSATATDNAGNMSSASTSFTVQVTPGGLCLLTKQFIQKSAKYQAAPAGARALADQLATALCQQLQTFVPSLSPGQKAALIAAFKNGVTALVPLGWLLPGEAAKLKALADAL